jgi:hypothetical protein
VRVSLRIGRSGPLPPDLWPTPSRLFVGRAGADPVGETTGWTRGIPRVVDAPAVSVDDPGGPVGPIGLLALR